MRDKVFVDTNIFIYALAKSKNIIDSYKRDVSLDLFNKLISSSTIIASVQVVNELHFNFVRKFNVDDEHAKEIIRLNVLQIANVVPLAVATYINACALRKSYKLSFWDSLVVASAIENNCRILYSEDMQEDLIIDNRLMIKNPFSLSGEIVDEL